MYCHYCIINGSHYSNKHLTTSNFTFHLIQVVKNEKQENHNFQPQTQTAFKCTARNNHFVKMFLWLLIISALKSIFLFGFLLLFLSFSLSNHTQTISNYQFESWWATALHSLYNSAQEMQALCFDLIHLLKHHEQLYINIFRSSIRRTSYWLEAQFTVRILLKIIPIQEQIT